jgi:uncharacterized membrane protein (DUF373 family)
MKEDNDNAGLNFIAKFVKFSAKAESLFSGIILLLLDVTLLVLLIRLIIISYSRIFSKISIPTTISTEDISSFFGEVITIFILKEFTDSLVNLMKRGAFIDLVKNVILVTGLAVLRKVILLDFIPHADYKEMISMAIILIALGIYYVAIKLGVKLARPGKG